MTFPNTAEINYIEYTFDATFDAYRDGEVQQPNGSIKTKRIKHVDASKCGLYVHRAEEYDMRRNVQAETGDFRVFTFRDTDILKGDEIHVLQYGRTYQMIAGEPIRYETHQEFVCREIGLA